MTIVRLVIVHLNAGVCVVQLRQVFLQRIGARSCEFV